MDKNQFYAAAFDAACFFLSNLNMFDSFGLDLDVFRKSLRVVIERSAAARVCEVEKMLDLAAGRNEKNDR